jgi:hypothetical protein
VEADDILEGVVVESTHTLSLALNLSCLSRTLTKNRDDEHERFLCCVQLSSFSVSLLLIYVIANDPRI